jgi:hypothetical protein
VSARRARLCGVRTHYLAYIHEVVTGAPCMYACMYVPALQWHSLSRPTSRLRPTIPELRMKQPIRLPRGLRTDDQGRTRQVPPAPKAGQARSQRARTDLRLALLVVSPPSPFRLYPRGWQDGQDGPRQPASVTVTLSAQACMVCMYVL